MPEIAEVARVVHFLRTHLVGKTIAKITAADDANVYGKVGTSAPAFEAALRGKRVLSAGSQGKYFWLELSTPPHPVMHFGMTGWVHIRGEQTVYNRYAEKLKDGLESWPPKYWKFHLEAEGGTCVAFTDARRFGRIRLVDCPGSEIRARSPLVENGPDPVVDRDVFTEAYFRAKMKGRHVPVKSLLLDQAMISGIGNWVGDEIMYHASLHPEQYCDDFSDEEIARLYRSVCYVCDTAVGVLGDSDQFPADWLFLHRWGKGKKDAGKTLPNGERIAFVTVGGRTSCFVPSRQKKTGRVPAGIKEEVVEDGDGDEVEVETKKGKVKTEKKSRFFEDKGDEDDREAETKPAKRPRTKKTKAEEKVKQEPLSDEEPDAKSKRGRKAKEKAAVPPADETGRRRSARLSKTTS